MTTTENKSTVLFFAGNQNRSISLANVKELYLSIKLRGYLKEVSKIEYLAGEVIQNCELIEYTVVQKDLTKPISLSNFELKSTVVEWSENIKAIVDGQHKQIALMLLNAIECAKIDSEHYDSEINNIENYKEVTLPSSLTISEFIAMKNTCKPWNSTDFANVQISTGNNIIDSICKISKDEDLLPQVTYDLFSLTTGSLSLKVVKGLRSKTFELPKSIEMNEDCIITGNEVLNALKESTITKDQYDNTRFSKGLKTFVKEQKVSINDVIKMISKIDKAQWERYFVSKDGRSNEAKTFKLKFEEFYKLVG